MIKKAHGFTIVELLIVIVVIAILAAISIVAYTGIQERAQKSKVQSDIAQIIKAISLAREKNTQTLGQITGNWSTGGVCWGQANGTDLATLPSTSSCWVNYNNFLNIISDESGMNIRGLTDPWGRPYLLDENEGEGPGRMCSGDTVAMYKRPFTAAYGVHAWTPGANVPIGRYAGCTT